MCGIAFIHNRNVSLHLLHGKLTNALSALTHRGPDEQGISQCESTLLGHRRLSIIDLASSHQPMRDSSGRYFLTYNGEIYNYKELRSQLSDRWLFQTDGDTEVLLAGLVLEGSLFLQKAEGMWAFVLWDNLENKLVAARDRMGKKPLYYFSSGGVFGAASEIPALLQLTSSRPSEDLDSTADFLRYGYYLPGTTAYKGVVEVLPGHTLTWSQTQGTQTTPYWALDIGGFSGTLEDAMEQTYICLTEAVKSRLVADVEVGAFLSGGIDSSLVVALMVDRLNMSPKTFTIGFNEKSFDERKFARQIASQYKTEHFEQNLDSWDRERLELLVLEHIGQPFYDVSLLPTDMLCQLAAKHVKVALSGDGGDELFSGYQRYQARMILRWYSRLPVFFRKNTERVIRLLPEPMQHHSRSILKKAYLFLDILDRQKCETPYIAPVLYSEHLFAELAGDIAKGGHIPPALSKVEPSDDIMEMMRADAAVYLPQDILVKVDRASMAHSLEVRAPFLDSRIVQLAFSFPVSWHRGALSGKRMLRKTFKEILPNNIWHRRKQGFGVPIHQWFRSSLGGELEGLLIGSPSFLNTASVLNMLNEHREGVRDHGYRLWNIYVYLLWKTRM